MTGVGRSGRGKMETTVLEQKERKKERRIKIRKTEVTYVACICVLGYISIRQPGP